MASQQQQAAPPHVVGNAFVHQYYHILHQSPQLVFRFYQERSKLGRPDAQGDMSCITTMQAINEKILSLEYSEYLAEIKTVDSQESFNGGVLVLVTGYLTGKDNIKRNFTQSFFLAPQDKGYFVLNDIFRYVDEAGQQQEKSGADIASGLGLSPEKDSPPPQEQQVPEQTTPVSEEEEEGDVEEVYNPSDNEEGSVVDEEATAGEVIDEVPNSTQAVVDSSAAVQEEAPKKSYASIVKVMKENVAPVPIPVATPTRPAPANPERQLASAPTPPLTRPLTPDIPASGSHATESGNAQEAEDGYSIYIKSLPLNATPAQLEEEFTKFGLIKSGGIQVRSNKQQGFCFGFVEFEVANAVQSAIEASPIMIGGRLAYVEEKRPSGSRVNSRGGRYVPGRGGGYRGDGMRGRGNYGGGRGYGRGDFSVRTDFGSRGGGRGGLSGRGDGSYGSYQRVDHSGNNGGRMNRPGVPAVNTSPKNVAPRVSAPA